MSGILLREREDGILFARMNRPEALNALNTALRKELQGFLLEVRDDPAVRVGILTGVDRAFSAGRDLKETAEVEQAGGQLPYHLTGELGYPGGLALGKPMIAAISGHCIAAGLKVAIGCDIRICSETAKFGNPQVRHGQGTDLPYMLVQAGVPRSVVMHMALTGDSLDAEQALRWGLVSHVLPPAELLPMAWAIARRIASNSPTVVGGVKRAAEAGLFDLPPGAALKLWPTITGMMGQTADRAEGVAAFVAKRTAEF